MSRTAEAKQIIEAVRAGNYILMNHAQVRSAGRSIQLAEIENMAHSVYEWMWQQDKGAHVFYGFRK